MFVTPTHCRRLVRYDPKTGKLFWRERSAGDFKYAAMADSWNRRNADNEAFAVTNGWGYRVGCLLSERFPAHRVAWAIYYGEWPSSQIDHVNGVPSDNRIENLRLVTPSENCRNKALRKDNASGVTGVRWMPQRRCWVAQIKVPNGRQKHLGVFRSLEAAAQARHQAEKQFSYHPNHGRAA